MQNEDEKKKENDLAEEEEISTEKETVETPEDENGAAEETEEQEDDPGTAIEVTAYPSAKEEQKESAFKRFMNFLFGKESRVGRVVRPVLRVAALVVAMLALGALILYFTLYLPVRNQRDQALAEVQRINLELDSVQAELEDSQEELAAVEESTSETIASLEEDLELANFKVRFLIAKNDVLRARMALLDEENGPGGPTAMAALNDLEDHLEDLLPYVEEVDPVLAGLLQDRLRVVKGEFARDAQQAKVELESFYANLLELEDTLFE